MKSTKLFKYPQSFYNEVHKAFIMKSTELIMKSPKSLHPMQKPTCQFACNIPRQHTHRPHTLAFGSQVLKTKNPSRERSTTGGALCGPPTNGAAVERAAVPRASWQHAHPVCSCAFLVCSCAFLASAAARPRSWFVSDRMSHPCNDNDPICAFLASAAARPRSRRDARREASASACVRCYLEVGPGLHFNSPLA